MLLWVLLPAPACRHGPGVTPTGWQVRRPRQRAPRVPLPIWPVVGATPSCPPLLGIKLTPGDSDPLFLIHPGIWRGGTLATGLVRSPPGSLAPSGIWRGGRLVTGLVRSPPGSLAPLRVAPSGRTRPAGSEDGPGLLSSQMSTPHRGGLSLFCEQAAPWTHPGA